MEAAVNEPVNDLVWTMTAPYLRCTECRHPGPPVQAFAITIAQPRGARGFNLIPHYHGCSAPNPFNGPSCTVVFDESHTLREGADRIESKSPAWAKVMRRTADELNESRCLRRMRLDDGRTEQCRIDARINHAIHVSRHGYYRWDQAGRIVPTPHFSDPAFDELYGADPNGQFTWSPAPNWQGS